MIIVTKIGHIRANFVRPSPQAVLSSTGIPFFSRQSTGIRACVRSWITGSFL